MSADNDNRFPVLIEIDFANSTSTDIYRKDIPSDKAILWDYLLGKLDPAGRIVQSQPAANIVIGLWLIHVQYDANAREAFTAHINGEAKALTSADLSNFVMDRFSISASTVCRCRKTGAVWLILVERGKKVPLAHSHLLPLYGLNPKQTCEIWDLVQLKYGTKFTEHEVSIVVAEELGMSTPIKKSSYDAIKERTREFLDSLKSYFAEEIKNLPEDEKIDKAVIKRIAHDVDKKVQKFRPIVDPKMPRKKTPKKAGTKTSSETDLAP